MAAGSVSAPLIIPIIHLETQRTKNHINTRTPVSIQSDTAGVLIYFTLDGSKPVVGQWGPAVGCRRYSRPILLPAGRVSIRAMAVTSDGRQSSIVTKVFSVDQLKDVDPENQQQHLSDATSCSAENADDFSLSRKEPIGSPLSGPRFLHSCLGVRTTSSCQRSQSAEAKNLSRIETSRVQQETDFLRCPHCLNARPADPLARFCAECGAVVPPLPGQRLPPAEAGQTLLCVFCNSVVPNNTHTCLICEAFVDSQCQPQARLSLQDHVVCVTCGSGNPVHISSCLTCERRLLQVGSGEVIAPSVPAADSRTSTCTRCKRLNQSNARFCDWCGAKSARAVKRVTCWRCGASGHPYALFCGACGVLLEAPPTCCSDITHAVKDNTTSQALSGSTPFLKVTPPTVDRHTQTVGLYYPSGAELEKKEQQKALHVPYRPPLTAISPGRGYWRKQLDHVCAHIRGHAQNNAPFRALLGEPRLGQMVSALIQEDHDQVSLTFSFVSAQQVRQDGSDGPAGGRSGPAGPAGGRSGPAGPAGGRSGPAGPAGGRSGPAGPAGGRSGPAGPAGGRSGPADLAESLSNITERSIISSFRCDRAPGVIKPAVSDNQLLKVLGPGGGQISTVQQLLDQGADPSCCGSDGRHALSVAVVNGHHDALPVLVQRGADVDQQSGLMKNTALHDAAAMGAQGLKCAEVLLRCKASVYCRNGAGQTVYDVAVTSGCSNMASLMMAQTGLNLLDQLGRPRLNLDMF